MTHNTDVISVDTLLELLADRRRRQLLHQLRDSEDNAATVSEVADALLETESDAEEDEELARRRLTVDLSHNHLPKLTDARIVDYDPRSRIVRYRRHDRVEMLLEFIEQELE